MTGDDHLNGHARPTAEQVAWVFHHLNEHYEEGGSFRQLIYGRMGFDESRYGILMGQGLHLSQSFELRPRKRGGYKGAARLLLWNRR